MQFPAQLKSVSSLTAGSRLKIQQAEPNEFDTRLVGVPVDLMWGAIWLFILYSIAILFCPTANDLQLCISEKLCHCISEKLCHSLKASLAAHAPHLTKSGRVHRCVGRLYTLRYM